MKAATYVYIVVCMFETTNSNKQSKTCELKRNVSFILFKENDWKGK